VSQAGNRGISYAPRPDATPDGERVQLAAVFAFVLNRHAERKAAGPTEKSDSRDDTKESEYGVARTNLSR
jgi:hypothetical protein